MPKKTSKTRMNQSEFAKALGVSQPMVAKYIREGHLDGCYERKGRRTIIDYEKAIAVLPGRLDPTRHGKLSKRPPAGKGESGAGGDTLGSIDVDNAELKSITYTDANTLDKLYAARLKKQKLDENAGRLVDKAEAVAGYARVIVAAKTKFMAVKSKVAPIINDVVDDPELAAEVIQLIDDIHREALNDLAAAGAK